MAQGGQKDDRKLPKVAHVAGGWLKKVRNEIKRGMTICPPLSNVQFFSAHPGPLQEYYTVPPPHNTSTPIPFYQSNGTKMQCKQNEYTLSSNWICLDDLFGQQCWFYASEENAWLICLFFTFAVIQFFWDCWDDHFSAEHCTCELAIITQFPLQCAHKVCSTAQLKIHGWVFFCALLSFILVTNGKRNNKWLKWRKLSEKGR